jgi:hypothetical protein
VYQFEEGIILFYFDYPKVKHSLGRAALQDPYPAWYLDTRGVIRGANLMAFWLWDTLKAGEPIRPDALLGKSVFNVFAQNFERIPADLNEEFYAKKSAIVKRMNAEMGSDLTLYTPFVAAMKADPRLENIYQQAALYPENEWENPIKITPPEFGSVADSDRGTRLLEFQVTNYRLERNTGFLAIYTPTPTTLPTFEKLYSLLADQYGDKVFMQQDAPGSNQLPANFESPYRPYYPTIIHDPLWYITGENRANRLLVGNSVVGMHFFELFFAPQLREWLGPLQETSAPRAVRYFDVFTATYLREDHELHAEYEQTMKHLLQLQDFRDLLEVSRKLNIRLNLPGNSEAPFYTCRVILPWPLSFDIALQFKTMVRFIHRNLFIHTDIRDYQVTLVPENYETEAALILLHLVSTTQELNEDDAGYTNSFLQFLWLLTVVKTIEEGLTQDGGEEDTQWEPESAFGRIRNELDAKFSNPAENETEKVIVELREIIEMLESKGILDKGILLSMLRSFVGTVRQLDRLNTFLVEEVDRHKGVKRI